MHTLQGNIDAAVVLTGEGIRGGPHGEAWGALAGMQFAAHGHTGRVAGFHKRLAATLTHVVRHLLGAASKYPQLHARATGAIGFLALHGIKQGRAGILFRPDNGKATGVIEVIVFHPVHRRHIPVADKVVFIHRTGQAEMAVGAGNETVLERVGTLGFLDQ